MPLVSHKAIRQYQFKEADIAEHQSVWQLRICFKDLLRGHDCAVNANQYMIVRICA